MPLQEIPEKDWDESYYKKCAQAILYNWGSYSNNTFSTMNATYEMWQCYQTFLMEQGGNSTVWMREPAPGVIANAQYIPGGITTSIVNYHIGAMSEFLSNAQVSALSLEEHTSSRRKFHEDAVMFQYNMSSLAQSMRDVGFMFANELPSQFLKQSEAQARRFAKSTFIDENESAAEKIAKASMSLNNSRMMLRRQTMHCLTSGLAAMEVDNSNPELIPRWREIPSPMYIKDRRVDSDLGLDDEFKGWIRYAPVSEVANTYNLTKEQADYLQSMVQRVGNPMDWGNIYGYPIFNSAARGGGVAVAKLYWHSYRDTRYTSKGNPIDKYGNAHIKYMSPDDYRMGKYFTPTIRTATIIGGDLIVDYGEYTNITYNPLTKRPVIPIVDCVPQMLFGRSRSMVSKLRNLEEYRDNLFTKFQQHVAQDFGNVLTFDTSMATKGTPTAYEIYQKIAQLRVVEYNGAERDGQKGNGIDIRNMGLSASSSYYFEAMRMVENEMRTISATSLPTQGLQTSTIGKGVMDNTIAANTRGNIYWMQTLYDHFNNLVQLTTDTAKLNMASVKQDYVPIVSDGQMEIINNTKELSFSNMLIKLRIDDQSPIEKKNLLFQIANGWANSGQVSPNAILDVMNADSYREAAAMLKSDLEETEERKAAAAQQQQQNAMQIEQQKANKDLAVAQTYTQGTLQSEQMKQQGADQREIIGKETPNE